MALVESGQNFMPLSREYLNVPNSGSVTLSPKYCLKSLVLEGQSAQTIATTPVVTTIYPVSSSFLSSNGDKVNLLWVTDNANRTAVNRTMLVHSVFDGTAWSAPQPVADDGTADFHPVSLTFSDGTIIAAWEDEKAILTDTATLDDTVAGMEVSASIYNPTTKIWGTASRLTADSYLHRTPKLAGKSKDNVLLTWLGNEANDLSGSSAKPNKLWYSLYNGATWSAPQVAAVIPNAAKRYNVWPMTDRQPT
jgi:hypothetical protein